MISDMLADKKHALALDGYISADYSGLIDALKKEGVFQQNNNAPKQQAQQQQSPNNFLAPPLPRKLPRPNEDAVNF